MVKDSRCQCTNIIRTLIFVSRIYEYSPHLIYAFVFSSLCLHSPVHTDHSRFPPSAFPLRLSNNTQRHTTPRSSASLGFPLPLSILAHKVVAFQPREGGASNLILSFNCVVCLLLVSEFYFMVVGTRHTQKNLLPIEVGRPDRGAPASRIAQ